MLISLNWIKDFVDIPADLDPQALALKFTVTTAEVEGVEHVEPNFSGLVAARIDAIDPADGEDKLRQVTLDAGRPFTTLSAAPDLTVGDTVVFGPPGASVGGHTFGKMDPAGRTSEGMIVAGQGLGLVQVGANALFLPPGTEPGQPIDAGLFDDWIIEIDNKSITHRPDLWGHYGIAREVAAILGRPLKPYDVTETSALQNNLPIIPIEIDDADRCPRYTGLLMKGLRSQPAPLWMQVRLARVGMRPIDLLVDLTNYIMAELGQPMHAFDGARLTNIQVARAAPGERFTTLDGVTRTMPANTLMIQCDRRSVAIAGIMGGAETEVSAATETILLESANFDAATIRRAATAMGHRTEASARFEKSLDPAHTVLGIARFHRLAQRELPGLELASTLSDCYPKPAAVPQIALDCDFASRFIGRTITPDEAERILSAIEFTCERDGQTLQVTPPSYRATRDIEIEEDVVEELARFIGYDAIEPTLPNVTTRFFPESPGRLLEEKTLDYLCVGGDFAEVHNYIWHDDAWLQRIGFDPGACLTLKNPAAEGSARLRRTLVPGLIAFAERNRHHYDRFQLGEIGSVFQAGGAEVETSQQRHLGLVVAQSGAKADGVVWDRLRRALDGWVRQVLEMQIDYVDAKAAAPWEDPDRLAELTISGAAVGRVTILPLKCKQKIDERLKSWSIAIAELDLGAVVGLTVRHARLAAPPKHPQVRLDFSALVDGTARYEAIAEQLRGFEHPLLRRLTYVESYEGKSIPAGKRSLTLRAEIGRNDRTLDDRDVTGFQAAFRAFLTDHAMELRG
ncbi:MAG: phenylalanine--tRNA ligase subunit beta [Phycisphaerae bacterium]